MNTRMFPSGRMLFALAVTLLGAELLITGNFPIGLIPIPATLPGRAAGVVVLGIAFVLAGLCMGSLWKARAAASGLGVLFLLLVVYPHVPILLSNVHSGSAWTALVELLALSAGAFYLAGILPQPGSMVPENRLPLAVGGRWLFAVSLLIFAGQHFLYAAFIATLIPSWIPAPLFWAYFVGVAFAATAISLLLNWHRRLSTRLLGSMFLLWVALLHLPRVVGNPRSEPEWTSTFVALAMGGIAFLLQADRPDD